MEDAGQFNQQVNRAAAFTVLHAADMLLACQAQANRQFLLRNATESANIVKSLTKLFCVKIHTFLLPHSRYRTGSTEGQKKSRMTVKKKSCADKTEHEYPIILSHAAFGRLRLSAAPQHSYDL